MTDIQLPEPELGYIKTDKSNQPAFSARQMREAVGHATQPAEVTDEQIAACVKRASTYGLPFVGLLNPGGTPSDFSKRFTAEILALRPAAQTEREADGLPRVVAGAIFDFAGFMTTRSEVIEVGSTAEAGPVADLVKEWAELRGLDLADAAVLSWQLHITRASLPAPQQATPEPVGEVVAWADRHDRTNLYWRKPAQVDVRPLVYGDTRPAPAAQAVPMTPTERECELDRSPVDASWEAVDAYMQGIADAEAHHGITADSGEVQS